MIIYRVEKNNSGPYRCSDLIFNDHHNHVSYKGRPNLSFDTKLYAKILKKKLTNYRFGFSDPEQLKFWFWNYKDLLKEKGFKIHIYRVSDKYAAKSEFQAVFNKDHSQLLKVVDF